LDTKRHIYNCQAGCPVESTLQIIAGKWKSVILYHLIKGDATHFGELSRAMNDCSRRMLALQLKELESDGVVAKTQSSLTPLKTNYELTDFGQTLEPVILAMEKWGQMYNTKQDHEVTAADAD